MNRSWTARALILLCATLVISSFPATQTVASEPNETGFLITVAGIDDSGQSIMATAGSAWTNEALVEIVDTGFVMTRADGLSGRVEVLPHPGEELTTGIVQATTSDNPAPGEVSLRVQGSETCTMSNTVELAIMEVEYTGGTLTRFAAEYLGECTDSLKTVDGYIRLNSDAPAMFADFTPRRVFVPRFDEANDRTTRIWGVSTSSFVVDSVSLEHEPDAVTLTIGQNCDGVTFIESDQCELDLEIYSTAFQDGVALLSVMSTDLALGRTGYRPIEVSEPANSPWEPEITRVVEAFDGVALGTQPPTSRPMTSQWLRKTEGSTEWEPLDSLDLTGDVVDTDLAPGESAEYRVINVAFPEYPRGSEPVAATRVTSQPPAATTTAGFSVTRATSAGNTIIAGRLDRTEPPPSGTSPFGSTGIAEVRQYPDESGWLSSFRVNPRLPSDAGVYSIGEGSSFDHSVRTVIQQLEVGEPDPATPPPPFPLPDEQELRCEEGTLTVHESRIMAGGRIHRLDATLDCQNPNLRGEIRVGVEPVSDEPRRDFDLDFTPDVLTRERGSGHVHLFAGTGAGSDSERYFHPRQRLGGTFGSPFQDDWSTYEVVVPIGDYDSDGRPDLLAADEDGQLWLYRGKVLGYVGSGSALFYDREPIGSTTWSKYDTLVGIGDYDGDGNPDLLTRENTGQLWLFRGRGRQPGETGNYFHSRQAIGSTTWSKYDMLL